MMLWLMDNRLPFFILFLASALLISLNVAACGKKQAVEENMGPRVTLVDASPARAQDVQVVIRSVGSLEAINCVKIAPEVRGFIEQILFEENQKVERGQLLAKLDDRKLQLGVQQARETLETALAAKDLAQATIKRAEADVESMKSTFLRDKELFEYGITSESRYIQSKSNHDSAQAAVEEAKAAYRRAEKEAEAAKTRVDIAREMHSDTRITAPLSGVLGERLVSPGDFVDAGKPLVELVVLDPIEIAFTVPEKYRGMVSMGQPVAFETPSAPDRAFSGETTFISPSADPATRTIKLKARLPNQENLLQPGLFGAVRLILDTHMNAPVIPEAAVVPREAETFVYTVNDQDAHLKKVTLGEHFDGMVEVLGGLAAGEVVITAGQHKVADGYPVRIRGNEEQLKQAQKQSDSATP
jgi:multidrug efflux pump subunit AcrA (membrane-fusion protein)